MVMVNYLGVNSVRELVRQVGLARFLQQLVDAMDSDYRRWEQFDKSARHAIHSPVGVIELMPTSDGRLYCFKYVNGHPKNTAEGLLTVTAFGVLADVDTGYPLLVSELTLTTALRTAAMSVLAARHLARPDSRRMALIGNGAQSEFQALAFYHLLGIRALRLFDTDPGASLKLERNLARLALPDLHIERCASAAEAVRGCDIVTTATADKRNATILRPEMIESGMHLNAVGGDCPGKTELHADILRRPDARVVVEFEPQSRIEGRDPADARRLRGDRIRPGAARPGPGPPHGAGGDGVRLRGFRAGGLLRPAHAARAAATIPAPGNTHRPGAADERSQGPVRPAARPRAPGSHRPATGAASRMNTTRPAPAISLIGAPTDIGAGARGASMGPEALRVAGLQAALEGRGLQVADRGNLAGPANPWLPPVDGYRHLPQVVEWNRAVFDAVRDELRQGRLPVLLGGDHSLGLGSISAVARHCFDTGRKLRVLWLDAHADFNTSALTPSGNVHGMPVACLCGFGPEALTQLAGMPGGAPALRPQQIRQIGIRSVDAGEKRFVHEQGLEVFDMRFIDEVGMRQTMLQALSGLDDNTHLHVSFDVDFLDPDIAPGVGTTVPGGPTYREAQLCMEMIADSGCLASLDIVELNPALDVRNKTALLAVDLVESLFGKSTLMRR
jgi:arginase